MVTSLIYTSHSLIDRATLRFQSEIESIRISALRQNYLFGITGFLFFFDNKFVQIIEGDFDNVSDLYKNIRRDKRHEFCRIVEFREINNAVFCVESMISSIQLVRDHSDDLQVKLSFLNRFINVSREHQSINIRNLLITVADELKNKINFPTADLDFNCDDIIARSKSEILVV